MTVDWAHFSPWSSLCGGVILGVSVALMLLGLGRVAGVAGLLARPFLAAIQGSFTAAERVSVAFIAGLIAAPWLWRFVAPIPENSTDVGIGSVILAGLLVGVGVRMANGCTSGHGICGLSRFSLRSAVNVGAFMGAGAATVYLIRHVL